MRSHIEHGFICMSPDDESRPPSAAPPTDESNPTIFQHRPRELARSPSERTPPLFGPLYAKFPELQRAVDHAERAHRALCEANAEVEADRRNFDSYAPSLAEEFLATRPDELMAFVGACVEDCMLGHATETAARSIERYIVDRVHTFLQEEFERGACCLDSTSPTLAVPYSRTDKRPTDTSRATTVAYPSRSVRPDSRGEDDAPSRRSP